MRSLEPNLLLAVSTGIGLALVVMTASVWGAGEPLVRNVLLAAICAVAFVGFNGPVMKLMRMPPRPPLIDPLVSNALVWASIFPMGVLIAAVIPVIWPGRDYGLLIIIAAVWFGLTADSALRARKGG